MYLILNYKTYPEATGKAADELTRIAHEADMGTTVNIVVCPQLTDLNRLKSTYPALNFWAQHVDPLPAGRNTGWITPTAIKSVGAEGSLVNHSEHSLIDSMIMATVMSLEEHNLQSCVCVPDSGTLTALARAATPDNPLLKFSPPTFTAYEPPELISGDVSAVASEFHLQQTKDALEQLQSFNTIPILGAGIKDSSDVEKALRLGFEGVLIASGFVKAEDPAGFLRKMLSAFPA